MRQYLDAKQQHRDAILFFRMGDFYEMFYEDALVAARTLDLTLTSRSKDANGGGIPMCGVPFHAVDGYIARLVKKGFRVAICDQVEDPRKAKGIVKREVVRVVSPGTLTDASYLDAREPAFLMAVAPRAAATASAAVGRRAARRLDRRVHRRRVSRRRRPAGAGRRARGAASRARSSCRRAGDGTSRDCAVVVGAPAIPITPIDGWAFDPESARRTLLDQLRAAGLEGFGLDRQPAAVAAAGALVHYLQSTQKVDLAHVRSISYRQRADALLIDPTTLKHLEILEGSEGGRDGSLLDELDRTITVDRQPDCCVPGCCGRCCRSIASAIASTRSKSSRSARPSAASSATRSRRSRTSSGWSRASALGHGRPARSRRPEDIRLPSSPASGRCSPSCQAPLVRSLVAELDDLADVRDLHRRDARRRSAGARARRRLHPRRRRRGARRAADDQPLRQAGHRARWRSASARAPASRR